MVNERAGPRVDERVMAAGTTVRFALLVVLLLVASSAMMVGTVSVVSGASDNGCMLAAGANPDAGDLRVFLGSVVQDAAWRACIARYASGLPPWWVAIAWPILLPVVASVLFFALPGWKARRGRVVPLDSIDPGGDLRRVLAGLVARADLARAPRFVIDPAAASIGAVVFGRNRRPTVCLHGGLLAQARTDHEGLRAVLLHELAHIRNGDVTITYATVALWRVFLAAVLVPFAGSAVLDLARWLRSGAGLTSAPSLLTRDLLLPVVMVVLVYLARSDVLRGREVYADLAAVRWGADPHRWVTMTLRPVGGRLRRAFGSFLELWHTHPRWDLRRDALSDPSALFDVPALPMFLTGTAATLINAQVSTSLLHYGGWWDVVAGVISAGLVTGVAGIALWRAAAYAVLTSRPAPSGVGAGLWLGFGMVAGELVMNRVALFGWLPAQPEVLALGVLAGTVFAWWVAQCAQLWLRVWQGRTTHPPMLLSLAAAGLALTSWFAWWRIEGAPLAMGSLINMAGESQLIEQVFPGPPGEHPAILSVIAAVYPVLTGITEPPLVTTAVTALWLVPLLALTIRPTTTPQWARAALGGTGEVGELLRQTPPPLSRALLPGLLGGVLCWAAVVVVQASMHAWPPVSPSWGLYALIYAAWLHVALVAAPTAAAVGASARVGHYRLLVALITAETAALVGLIGMFVLLSLDGCTPALNTLYSSCHWDPASTWLFFQPFLAPGVVLPGLVAIGAAATVTIFQTVRPSRPRSLDHAPDPGRPRRGLSPWRVSVAALSIAAVGITATGEVSQMQVGQETPDWQQALRTVDDAAVSPRTRATQVIAWTRVGGRELTLRFADDLQRIGDAMKEALAEAPNGVVTNQASDSRIRPACIDLSQLPRDAASMFRVPDPQAQQLWQTLTAQAGKAGADCVQALDQHDDALFTTAATELGRAGTTGDLFSQRLKAVADQGLAQRVPPGSAR